jgi:hypothetical protein
MPRNVRNWWIEGRADGASGVSFGPKAADGGFELTIYQRDRGSVSTAIHIDGRVVSGRLILAITDDKGEEIERITSER